MSIRQSGQTKIEALKTAITNLIINHNNDTTSHPDIRSSLENKNNKVSSWSNTTTNTNYPSEKLVKDTLDNMTNAVDYYFDDITEEIIFDYGLVTDNLIVADNLTTNSSTQVLSAKQGKILNEKIGEAINYINQ